MMKSKRLAAAFLTAAMALSLTACGGNSGSGNSGAAADSGAGTSSGDKIEIAYIVKAKSDAFWTSMEDGAMKYADEVGVKVDFQAPEKETDVEKQVQFV